MDLDPSRQDRSEVGPAESTSNRRGADDESESTRRGARSESTSIRHELVVAVWAALLTAAVIGPMAGRGWVLTLDWVTGPASSYAPRIGAGTSLPAGPLFFAGAALLHALSGAAVGWLVPAVALVVAGWAGGRTGAVSLPGRLAAVTAAIVNPFVHERLYAGQVAMLAGYAVLVLLLASLLGRAGGRAWLRWGWWWAVAAACSAQFVVLAGLLVVAVVLGRRSPPALGARLRTLGATSAVGLGLTALWLVPLAASAPPTGGAATATAFATRADPHLGLALGTLLQRGFWRASPAAPGLWGGWPAAVAALSVGLMAAYGGRRAWRSRHRGALVGLSVLAGSAWVASWGPSGPLGPAYRAAVDTVPGFGLFREAGKFLALLAVFTVFLLGAAADALAHSDAHARPDAPARPDRLRPHRRAVTVAVALLVPLLPLAATPSLLWGVGGRLGAVQYPDSWQAVAVRLRETDPGTTLVLPLDAYLDPGFTGGRVVANPARAYFGSRVVVGDDPELPGLGPSARIAALAAALNAPDRPAERLAELGITGALALAPDVEQPLRDAGFELVFRHASLSLWRNPAR